MADFNLYVPIQVRYSDIDAQGHVNNARYLNYLEQARVQYLLKLGLWNAESFLDLGMIVADVHVSFLAPILLNQSMQVGIRATRLGNKSLTFVYQIEDARTGQVAARCETVMVTYNYHTNASIPIPPDWRERIASFDSIAQE
jgi:acyl-CoA thioester hydrolase